MTLRPSTGTLITVAPTGAEHLKGDLPQLPTTTEELVETAVRCEAAGAALIHIHRRDAGLGPRRVCRAPGRPRRRPGLVLTDVRHRQFR